MPRFFLHLRDGTGEILDEEGVELSHAAIAGAALLAARDCMAADVKQGRVDLNHRIDVHDESGEIAQSLIFADALEITPLRSGQSPISTLSGHSHCPLRCVDA